MDVSSVGSLLSSLKTATEIARFIKDSDLTIEKAEAKLKLAELVSALADIKLEASEIQQGLAERNDRIRELELQASLRVALKWRQPCYWLINPDGLEEPYCQKC